MNPTVTIQGADTETDTWTGEEVDGILRLKEERDEIQYKHILPYRSDNYQNTPYNNPPPYVWLWENPQEPIENITLEPSFQTSQIHVKIANGSVIHIQNG